ncbi:MAG: Gfo/Idh/MocA family oxidoreductase [Firmicutes bacterium]|nr:Gfo/Idh/MocA family oxidoreductase [Bacillota bacterium]
MNFPLNDKPIRIGILGMTEGNAHPFSWSAMINGYDHDEMFKWTNELYPTIPQYLAKQPKETFGIPGVKVTHVCFTGYEEREMAENCARASFIPNVVTKPEEMIGQVDAIICATDIGSEHVERCRPFIEAGLPIFIDKPLADNEEDLRTIVKWYDNGAHIQSSSSMRYVKSFEPFYKNHSELGNIRYIVSPMAKYWETYGMHAIEAMHPLLGQGFEWVENLGDHDHAMVHLRHKNGCDVSIPMGYGFASNGLTIMAQYGSCVLGDSDSYYAFKKQLDVFVHYLRTGEEEHPFSDTIEMAKILIAGLKSRDEGGRRVYLNEIKER